MRTAGLKPAAVICEIMNDDGSMARVPQLLEFCQKHNLKITSIARLIEHRLQRESQVRRVEAVHLPTDYGEFKLIGYESLSSPEPHLALCKGGVGQLDEKGAWAIWTGTAIQSNTLSRCLSEFIPSA